MKLPILIPLLILSIQTFSQFKRCDSLIIRTHHLGFDPTGIRTTFDYIRKYYPKQMRYISDRNELESLTLEWNADSTMCFADKEDRARVKISFSTKHINPTKLFYPKSKGEAYSLIREYGEGLPYGVTSEDTTAVFISEIKVNGRKIPTSAFSDLLNPNRYKTIASVKPIEVYKSRTGEYIFIYIFGEPNTDILSIDEAIGLGYMAKLVLSKEGYYIDRIVVRGDILRYFGHGECPYFKGF